MSVKLSLRSVLVAASLAVLAALQTVYAGYDIHRADYENRRADYENRRSGYENRHAGHDKRFDVLATDCNENLVDVYREPYGRDDPDLSIRLTIREETLSARQACGRAAARLACKSKGFDGVTEIYQRGDFVEGRCKANDPFDPIGFACDVQHINVIRKPWSVDDPNRVVSVRVHERDKTATDSCVREAAHLVCTSVGFGSAINLEQRGNVASGLCSPRWREEF